MRSMLTALQLAAAVLVLGAFAWSQLGDLDPAGPLYLWLNAIGTAVLAALALQAQQWGFVLLEGAWAAISLAGIARLKEHQPPTTA